MYIYFNFDFLATSQTISSDVSNCTFEQIDTFKVISCMFHTFILVLLISWLGELPKWRQDSSVTLQIKSIWAISHQEKDKSLTFHFPTVTSTNSLIPGAGFSMRYRIINHAFNLMKPYRPDWLVSQSRQTFNPSRPFLVSGKIFHRNIHIYTRSIRTIMWTFWCQLPLAVTHIYVFLVDVLYSALGDIDEETRCESFKKHSLFC